MLGRIRAALTGAPPEPVAVPRDYFRDPLTGPADVERFAEAVAEYRARVHRVTDIAATVRALVAADATVVTPADAPADWVTGVHTLIDAPPLDVSELDRADAVLTGCAVGIAATGTIVLDAGPTQGRRALTLVPDHHICVVRVDQIVDTVPQGFAALDPTRPLTFISGPSATSDIELQRVEGVHGPRTLDVLIVP
ncbi:LutC/YkgG family protein [Mycolicibacterium sp. J2]|uniref:LutC/YkgG family protein n=1 Tax=Mycolicibacterium sp. J2 TaxID=2993511 RepID=UPI00224B630F|nr:LUD domain-containing protein [Mycolicibacterium sp. J2]MCX2711732.1 LUD domain-containing protein [Mycolicibacterium sp. J2]